MGEKYGSMEKNLRLTRLRRLWGFHRWTRHSTILMVVGFLFVLVGVQYILTKPSPGREIALAVILQVAPIQFWGSLFIVAGLLSMLSSRWPPMTETWGYMVLTGLSSGWAATYLMGIIFFDSPATNTTQVILWGCLAFLWWAISGLLNPDKTAVTNHDGN